MDVNVILQLLIGAILQGALYALGAFGLALSFGVLKVLNLSHGDFVMLGGLFGFLALIHFGINPFFAAILATVIGFLIGLLFYRVLINRVVGRPFRHMLIASVMTTLGIALIIEDLTSFLWGGGSTGIPFQMPNLVLGSIVFPGLRMALLGGTILLTVGLDIFLRKTFRGRAIVASSINRIGAVVVGINTQLVAITTFAIGVALAAGTGVFYAALYSVEPFMGLSLTLKYLAVIIVGGMGSLSGSMLGGFVIAVAETYTSYFLGAQWAPMVAFIILIVALLVRPEGLMGRK